MARRAVVIGGIAASYLLSAIGFFFLAKGALANPMAVVTGFAVFAIMLTTIATVSAALLKRAKEE